MHLIIGGKDGTSTLYKTHKIILDLERKYSHAYDFIVFFKEQLKFNFNYIIVREYDNRFYLSTNLLIWVINLVKSIGVFFIFLEYIC